jgi:hypothetical protein
MRWNNLETGAFVFWYRGSPRPLKARAFDSDAPIEGSVWTDDPPLTVSGVTLVQLNPLGRLTQLVAVSPQVKPAAAEVSPDRTPLFLAAGLDPSKWTQAPPTWTPPIYSDTCAAWTGALPERPEAPMRIEAAAYRGKPVYFDLIGPWTRPQRMQTYQATIGERAGLAFLIIVLLSILVVGAFLGRRNLRLGRGDRQGALRLAAFVFGAWAVAWFFGAHHIPDFGEVDLFIEFLLWGLGFSGSTWLLYIALEPYVRRRWPNTLVSWTRFLAGGFRDPLVGRDVLVGCLSGAFTTALGEVVWFVPSWLGHLPPRPFFGPRSMFLGARMIIADSSSTLIGAPFTWLAFLFVLFLLRVLLRKDWAAAIAFVLLGTVANAAAGQPSPAAVVFSLILFSLFVFLMMRFGLLTLVTNFVVWSILTNFPLATHGSAWYAGISLAGILLMAAIVFYAFYTSLGGRALFGVPVLEE